MYTRIHNKVCGPARPAQPGQPTDQKRRTGSVDINHPYMLESACSSFLVTAWCQSDCLNTSQLTMHLWIAQGLSIPNRCDKFQKPLALSHLQRCKILKCRRNKILKSRSKPQLLDGLTTFSRRRMMHRQLCPRR